MIWFWQDFVPHKQLSQKLKEDIVSTAQKFKLWKQIRIGTGLETAEDFVAAIKAAGMWIGENYTTQMLRDSNQLKLPKKPGLIQLTNPSLDELGLRDKHTPWEVVFNAGVEQGLLLCPHEVGPQLRIQYSDQPVGKGLMIAMEPIWGSTDYSDIFTIGNKDGSKYLLDESTDNPGLYGPEQRFVFQLPPEA